MSHRAEQPVLRQEQFDTLRSIIYAHVGIHFPDGKKPLLESRIARRVAELNLESFDQYCKYLTIAPQREQELQEMLSRVTVNHTSFFRDPGQIDFIGSVLLPRLIDARRRERSLRVWSAACSTGEEAYTLAVLVHKALGERLPDWRVEILGTDVSPRALEAAAAGRFTDDAVRAMDPAVRARYFRQDGPYWVPDAILTSMVSFDAHNLKDRLGAKRYGLWDAVVCRNAMIYFDDAMRARVATTLAGQLRPDGALVLGATEGLDGLNVPLQASGEGPSRIYTPAPCADQTPSAGPAPRPLRLA